MRRGCDRRERSPKRYYIYPKNAMKIILTGASGMVGEGVLMECMANENIEAILMVNRKHIAVTHPKLKELIITDFSQVNQYQEQLIEYDACFYCAGKSVLGMNEEAYFQLTYTTTIEFAKVLQSINPGIVFNYITGGHTDSTENGKQMWARVKGKTENALRAMFETNKQFNFRPALMKPTNGQKNFTGYNKYLKFLYPIFSLFFPACTIQEIALAMINSVKFGYPTNILEVADIKKLAHQKIA